MIVYTLVVGRISRESLDIIGKAILLKKEKALSDLADKLNAKITEDEKVEANEAIPVSSETYGSGDEVDFDISEYLD